MKRTPKYLQHRAWEGVNTKYASLDYPEWISMSRLPLFFWHDKQNHQRYITWLGRKLDYKNPEDWYGITVEDFTKNRGSGFLGYYNYSPYMVVKHHFPKRDWKAWLFPQAPQRYWNDLKNCLAYANWFEKRKRFTSIKGWYGVTQDDLFASHGAGLLDHFACSVQRFVTAIYPEHEWIPWMFAQVPKNFWCEKKNRIAYTKWLELKLGYRRPEDWYRVSTHDFIDHHGGSLMQMGYKTVELIHELYPEQEWQPWMFRQVYKGYWKKKSNRTDYLKWLEAELGYKTAEDWLQVKRQDFSQFFGTTLIRDHYAGRLDKPVRELYPASRFMPWEFSQVTFGFWDQQGNCRSYLNWLGKRLGFKRKEDWYQVRREDFRNHCGNGFLKRFKTPYEALKIAFPKYHWLPWLFENVPVGFWSIEENRNWFFRWLGGRLGIQTPSEWLRLSAEQLRANHGNGILRKMSVREIGAAAMRDCAR